MMLRNITIGKYYPGDSVIHALDPRIKLITEFIYIITLFIVNSGWGYGFVALCAAVVIIMSKVPFRYLLSGLRSIVMIALFTVAMNVFFTPGETTLFRVFGVAATLEGVLLAAKMSARLILLIISSSVLTLTTPSIDLTDAIEFCLSPFKRIGMPAHEIAMMMTIALRFVPTLLEETDKIMKAQMARGADFDSGGLIRRSKSLVPLLVPLFISAFRRADELAVAMEARCYRGGANRTRMKQFALKRNDYAAIAATALFTACAAAIR
jgi:energy-coupling factor transport system permease protein